MGRKHGTLSPRQKRILLLYSKGLSRAEVAEMLGMRMSDLEYAEALISDRYKEYEMADCARKWRAERGDRND